MSKLFKLGILFVVIYTITSLVIARHVSKDRDPKSVRCRNSVSMIGQIPHPMNCYKFYLCATAPPESGEETMPIEMDCPNGTNGPLYYDFRSCQCNYTNTGCFDPSESQDNKDFFICSDPYNVTEFATQNPPLS